MVLVRNSIEELTGMKEVDEASKLVGLQINLNKTKIVNPGKIPVASNNITLKIVDGILYLGHKIKLGKNNETVEIF